MFLPPEEVWIDHRPLDLSGNITSLVTGQSPFGHKSVIPEDTRDKKSPEGKARQRLDLAGRSVLHWFFLTYPFLSLCRVCSSMLTTSLSWVWRNLWDHRVTLSALAPTMGYSETLEGRDNLRTLTSPQSPHIQLLPRPVHFGEDCKDIWHETIFVFFVPDYFTSEYCP